MVPFPLPEAPVRFCPRFPVRAGRTHESVYLRLVLTELPATPSGDSSDFPVSSSVLSLEASALASSHSVCPPVFSVREAHLTYGTGLKKEAVSWGAWVAQLFEHQTLDFGSGRDLTVRGIEPRVRLCA